MKYSGDLKAMLNRFYNGHKDIYKSGEWSIEAPESGDTVWVLYHKDSPLVKCGTDVTTCYLESCSDGEDAEYALNACKKVVNFPVYSES